MPSVIEGSAPDHNVPDAASAPEARWRWRLGRPSLSAPAQRELILALLLLLCYGFFRQLTAWNEFSRYDLVLALVDDHTTRIDPYHENTGDKAFFNGHYYSDKPPGASLLALPAYATLRGVTALTDSDRPDPGRVMHTFTFVAAGIPTVLLAVLLLRFLRTYVSEWWALTMTVGYALGSIAFPFATMFFGHAATAFFLFSAFYVTWRARGTHGLWRPIIAGMLIGYAVLTELPALIGGMVIVFYALSIDRRAPVWMLFGALPAAAILFWYNWVSFGSPFNTGYSYLVNSGFAEGMDQGILGVTMPKVGTIEELIVGPRGLLRTSPWMALAPLGLLAMRRSDVRREVIACAAIGCLFILFNAGYYLPLGGWTPGPRFLMPALPFLPVMVALAPSIFRPLAAAQIAFSIVVVVIATVTMPNAPEAVQDPLGDLWLPRFQGEFLTETTAWLHWGLHGLQPLFVLILAAAIGACAIFATTLRTRHGPRLVLAGGFLLGLLVLLFGTPFDLRRDGGEPIATGSGVRIAMVDTDIVRIPGDGGRHTYVPWAQIENRGAAVDGTTVIFAVHALSGERIWAAWYGDVHWRAGERKRLNIEWSSKDAAPGVYRLSAAVTSADQQKTVAEDEQIGLVQVR